MSRETSEPHTDVKEKQKEKVVHKHTDVEKTQKEGAMRRHTDVEKDIPKIVEL
jgi:hypothetical protein